MPTPMEESLCHLVRLHVKQYDQGLKNNQKEKLLLQQQFARQLENIQNQQELDEMLHPTTTSGMSHVKDLDKVATQNMIEEKEMEDEVTQKANSDKFMVYYPISGPPFLSFSPKLEIAGIVKK